MTSFLKKYFLWALAVFTIYGCNIFKNHLSTFPQIHPETPVIIIPGIMGSQLVDTKTGDVVWGKVVDLKAVDPHQALIHPEIDGLELPTDQWPITENRDRLIPTNILGKYQMINRLAEVEAYEGLIKRFSQCGLQEGNIQACTAQDNLYLFSYDWRRDLVESATLLGERIEAIKRITGNPHQKVSIVAHSMGGIIAQYYLMYGAQDVISGVRDRKGIVDPDYRGAKNVDKIFFLGVPFGGSQLALKTLHEGEYLGPLVETSQWATFTMLSIYEMLPLDTMAVFAKPNGDPVVIDHFDVNNWIKYGVGIFGDAEWNQFERECAIAFPGAGEELSHQRWFEFKNFVQLALERGKYFQLALAKMEWEKVSTKQIIFGGNCHDTMSRVEWLERKKDKPIIRGVKSRRFSEKYYHTEKGDNTVLYTSVIQASAKADWAYIGCFKHRSMPSNPKIQEAIFRHF